MSKRLMIISTSLLFFCSVFAAAPAPLINAVRADPPEIPVHVQTKLMLSARIVSDAQHIPVAVHLLRLQWSGNEREVSRMWDDGSNGDRTKKDGVYTCTLKLKEPTIGLLSFRVEVKYKGSREPVRSQAIFVNVVGGS